MNLTLKEATAKEYYYHTHQQIKEHIHTFLSAYNFPKRLKTLNGLTPYEHIVKIWQTDLALFLWTQPRDIFGLTLESDKIKKWLCRKEFRRTKKSAFCYFL